MLTGDRDLIVKRSSDGAGRPTIDAETAVARLRAAAEPTRLRILALLAEAELSVKELTQVLGQSQPRISRHLKLLAEAGLVSRFKEGAWVNIRLGVRDDGGAFAADLVSWLDKSDPTFARDRHRANAILGERARSAERYFEQHAAHWDEIRSLHVDEAQVERAMLSVLGDGPFESFLDLGTGTGRILELFKGRYTRGLGVDSNPSMLAYARSRLETAGLDNAQVRQGDLFNIAANDDSFDAVVVHQVLHFLDDLPAAIAEIGRVMRPGGQLLIADFAPHEMSFLQERFAHRRLGIPGDELGALLKAEGLVVSATETLAPPSAKGTDGLTVTLWLAVADDPSKTSRETQYQVAEPELAE